jgi:hypothetical protein
MADQKELEKKFELEKGPFMEGIFRGLQIGMKLKKEEIAIRMVHAKEPIDKIMQWTGISWRTIKETVEFQEIPNRFLTKATKQIEND